VVKEATVHLVAESIQVMIFRPGIIIERNVNRDPGRVMVLRTAGSWMNDPA
jgi:hypothetical protein